MVQKKGDSSLLAFEQDLFEEIDREISPVSTDGNTIFGDVNSRRSINNSLILSSQISKMSEPWLFSREELDEKKIIHPASRERSVVNRFRELRTKLLEISGGSNFSLVVTSALEQEGASFVAMNLAAAFCFDAGKTALLVDCNLRNPSLHDIFEIEPESGLTDFLEGPNVDVSSIIYTTGIQRMRLVPAGSGGSLGNEFFTTLRMREFVHAIRNRYSDRFVIFDAPSLSDSPDARILSEFGDYTLVVAPHGKVTDGQLRDTCASISDDKLVGVVLNN